MKTFYDQHGRKFERLTRWVRMKTDCNIGKRHSLYDYRMDNAGFREHSKEFDPSEGTWVDYYTFRGQKMAVERFWLLQSMYINSPEYLTAEDGEKVTLNAMDMDGNIFDPLYIEISKDCEQARFYKAV